MRTSIDFPEPIFFYLKTRAAMEGSSLRELVLTLIERGMMVPPAGASAASLANLPSVRLGSPMALGAAALSNAHLSALLDE